MIVVRRCRACGSPATGTEQNASLISNRSTSSIVSPARSSAFGIASVGPEAGARGLEPDRRPRHDPRQRREAVRRRRSRVDDDHHRGGAVVEPGRVAGGDGEALDLGVERLAATASFSIGVPARGCSSTENVRCSPSRTRHLDGTISSSNAAVVDRRDGARRCECSAHSSTSLAGEARLAARCSRRR